MTSLVTSFIAAGIVVVTCGGADVARGRGANLSPPTPSRLTKLQLPLRVARFRFAMFLHCKPWADAGWTSGDIQFVWPTRSNGRAYATVLRPSVSLSSVTYVLWLNGASESKSYY